MTFAFYAVNLCNRIGYHFTFLTFALLGSVAAFAPMVVLMLKGREIRERMGEPRGVSRLEKREGEGEEVERMGEKKVEVEVERGDV